jgi:hypothetical protein
MDRTSNSIEEKWPANPLPKDRIYYLSTPVTLGELLVLLSVTPLRLLEVCFAILARKSLLENSLALTYFIAPPKRDIPIAYLIAS